MPLSSRLSALIQEMPCPFWYLWLGTVVNRLGGFAVPFLMLYLTSQLAITPANAALMVSILGAGSFISQLIGGELTDRLGRRPVMLMSFLVAPAAMLALGLARAPWQIMLAMFVLGFFMDLYRPAVSAAVTDLVAPEQRTRAFGYIYWAINIGAALAPVLAGLMANYNYFLLFAGDALTTLVFGLVVLMRVPETRPAEAASSAQVSLGTRIGEVARQPVLLVFALLTLLLGCIYAQGTVTLPLAMADRGLPPGDYGLAAAVNGGLIVVLTLQSIRVIERWPRFLALAVAAILMGLGFGLTGLATSLPFFALTVAIWTLGEIIGATMAPVVISELAPVEKRGLYQGINGSAWGLAFFVGPALGGWVYEGLGPATLWAGCLGLGVLLALAYLALSVPARRKAMAQP